MAERFLTSVQASQLLGINPDTMRRYLREGKVRALRLGRDWKIPESALSDLARGGRLAKGGKPIASTHTPKTAPSFDNFFAKAEALQERLRASGYTGANGAEMVNAAREERTTRIIGDDRE